MCGGKPQRLKVSIGELLGIWLVLPPCLNRGMPKLGAETSLARLHRGSLEPPIECWLLGGVGNSRHLQTCARSQLSLSLSRRPSVRNQEKQDEKNSLKMKYWGRIPSAQKLLPAGFFILGN